MLKELRKVARQSKKYTEGGFYYWTSPKVCVFHKLKTADWWAQLCWQAAPWYEHLSWPEMRNAITLRQKVETLGFFAVATRL